jgi:hypothetical protein
VFSYTRAQIPREAFRLGKRRRDRRDEDGASEAAAEHTRVRKVFHWPRARKEVVLCHRGLRPKHLTMRWSQPLALVLNSVESL